MCGSHMAEEGNSGVQVSETGVLLEDKTMLAKRFIGGLLVLAIVLGLGATGTHAAEILFVSSMDPAHMPGDDALKAFMEDLGHTVTYFDDDESEADTEVAAAAADLVFISESVGSGGIRTEITEIETPMVITECWGWDEMGLTSGGGAGQNVVTTDLEIVAEGHPLAAGLSGTVPVLTALASERGTARFGNGIAGDEALVIAQATLADNETYDVIFVYERGAALPVAPADGSPQFAADTRVCLGFDEQSYLVWNENAYALLRAAIDCAMGTLANVALAYRPEPTNGADAVLTPLFRWMPGDGAVLHDVYIGTTPDLGPDDLVASRQPLTMYWHLPGLDPGVTYYWRVDEVEMDTVTTHTGTVWSFTMQAMTAYKPDPADGSLDAPAAPNLTWLPGQTVAKHHVYFGDSLDAVTQGAADADKGETTDPNFAPGTLDGATDYYWRVDEIAVDGQVRTGAVWAFTTNLPVDGFEAYTDEEGSRIYETWIDGWTNDTGSTVGYVEAPFAEQNIVNSGVQSMPLDYNNVNAPFYSEAEREFAAAQDWTVNDVTTLVLAVRGRPTNAAATLSIMLEDASRKTATVAYSDPEALTKGKWTEWAIPLSDFAGVNLARVQKIYISVGDRDNPTPGGSGLLFIDDIRVRK